MAFASIRLFGQRLTPLGSAADCDRQGVNGPFVLIATAVRTAA